jgi:predicted sulfurtransferase
MKKFPGKHFKGSLFVFDNRVVTPVEDSENREVVARCFDCGMHLFSFRFGSNSFLGLKVQWIPWLKLEFSPIPIIGTIH